MYPPLCFADGSAGSTDLHSQNVLESSLGEDEYALITDGGSVPVQFKFKLLEIFDYKKEDVATTGATGIGAKVKEYGISKAAEECNIGIPTLTDIIGELEKPGRDIRDELPKPMLRTDIMDMNDLREGMELTGTVRNVIDFGVFVDIGVHQDGLVHISQICDRYIKHPSEVLKVGEIVKVKVLSVEPQKKRISLTMKGIQ